MNKKQKEMYLLNADEVLAEVQRRIKECRDKKKRKLDLSHYWIKEIPPELAELDGLTELDLLNINQTALPDFLGNLTGLKILKIGAAYSSPHKRPAYIVPDTLANLTKLQTLYLGYNIPKIPSWIFTLKNLKMLTICNDEIDAIPPLIENFTRLEGLQIHGEKITNLPESLDHLTSLRKIILDCPALTKLPESFANLKNLESITLTNYNIPVIPDYFCGFTELVELTISMCSTFQGPFTPTLSLPQNIGRLKNLRSLLVKYSGLKRIPPSIGDTALEHLLIYGGNFTTMPESIGNISTLKTLEIFCPLKKVPDTLGNLTSLKKLSLGGEFKCLPESLGNLSSLEELDIDAEDTFIKLPDSIGNCKNLKKLSIGSDKLTELPDSICGLKALETLFLATFNLQHLPLKIGKLSKLKNLAIESEALAEIPASMAKLEKLEILTIVGSKVKVVQPLVEKLSHIKSLDLACGTEIYNNWHGKTSHKNLWGKAFVELRNVNFRNLYKVLEKYSLAKLEAILCDVPSRYSAETAEKEIIDKMLLVRLKKLNSKFEWSKENIERIVTVSDMFLKCWEDGFNRAKKTIDLLYANSEKKANFVEGSIKYSLLCLLRFHRF
ncbi:hypothetical protein FACS1894163_09670 [Spirochaetia bacterium]|nr:hypothetical protein FACS1894163_09670 [Spirochaetia bacterium]